MQLRTVRAARSYFQNLQFVYDFQLSRIAAALVAVRDFALK